MALVLREFVLSVTLLDNSGNDTSVSYQLKAVDYAEAVTARTAILTALLAATAGAIGTHRLTEVFEEDAITLPTDSAQAEVSASLTAFVNDSGNKKGSYRIPMPKPAVFVSTIGAGANLVNTTNALVTAYHALFEPAGVAYFSDGEEAGGLLGGVRVTRSKRGG